MFSQIPQFSKLLKKFVEGLGNFIDEYKILSNNQYGFKTNHSTAMALIDLIHWYINCST